MTSATETSSLSLRAILRFLFKHERRILGLSLGAAVLVAVGSYVVPPSYRAFSKVFVERTTPVVPDLFSPSYHVMELDEVINSEMQMIASRSVAEAVVDSLDLPSVEKNVSWIERLMRPLGEAMYALGLLHPIDDRERQILRLQKLIEVRPVPRSDIIQIAYSAENPRLAADIVNAVTDSYVQKRQSIYHGSKTSDIYREQLEQSKAELEELLSEQQRVKSRTGISSPVEERRMLLQEMERLSTERHAMELDRREIEQKLKELSDAGGQGFSSFSRGMAERNRLIDAMGTRLLDLRMRLVELSQRPSRQRQGEVNLQEEIKALEGSLREGLRSMLTSLRAREESVARQIAAVERKLESVEASESGLRRLSLAIGAQEKAFMLYQDKFEGARFQEAGESAFVNVKIIDRATVPQAPRFSRLTLILIGLVSGAVVGLGASLVTEYFDHSLQDAEQVRARLDLPALATIPVLPRAE